MRLGIITGFTAEARILSRLSPFVACAGGSADRAQSLATDFVAQGCDALLSCGIAGGLSPDLPSGSLVIGRKVRGSQGLFAGADTLCDWLAAGLPEAAQGVVAASDTIIDSPVTKRSLFRSYNALCVDMESWGLARAALECSVPFAILRVVADPAQRSLPPAALVGMDEDGTVHPLRVIRSLLGQPSQLPSLIRVAIDTQIALSSLAKAVSRLRI